MGKLTRKPKLPKRNRPKPPFWVFFRREGSLYADEKGHYWIVYREPATYANFDGPRLKYWAPISKERYMELVEEYARQKGYWYG